MKRATISQVAKQAGVSSSTISNYINGRYDNMSCETRRKIEEVVQKLNYTPNISARRLSSKKFCKVICLIIPVNITDFFSSFYYPSVLSAIGQTSARLNYNILIYLKGGKDPVEEIAYLKGMYNTMADGFLLFDLDNNDYYFREFEAANIPYMCVGKYEGIDDYPYIATNHEKAVEDAVDHLVALGHKKIALINERGSGVVLTSRRRGFEKSMNKNGCAVQQKYLVAPQLYSDRSENRKYIDRMLKQKNPPTAVIASTFFAQDIEQICKLYNIRIPDDLSVVLLDYVNENDFAGRKYTYFPDIAAVVAEQAFLCLVNCLQYPEMPFESKLIDVDIVKGESTTSIKTAN